MVLTEIKNIKKIKAIYHKQAKESMYNYISYNYKFEEYAMKHGS
jgi:hypothetical protein